jgi:phosphate starvation-inducible PhoH-like protein
MPNKQKEFTKGQKRDRKKMTKRKKEDSTILNNYYKKDIKIEPRNEAQARYLMAIESKKLVFSTGPAGTGKTHIALAYAAKLLEQRKIDKIIVTRPLVEAGRDVGALPGELDEKLAPFFQPPKDILVELLGQGPVDYYIKNKNIEFQPLEFLRGSTFKNSMIILDEGQNVDVTGMRLFLSRIGGGCKVVVNGDVEQSDLNSRDIDGMTDAINKLQGIDELEIIEFEDEDIVRSKLAKQIIMAYRNN